MISDQQFRQGMDRTSRSPFRVVPFFDPAPWGGQWMKEVCDLPREEKNYGWCFDCVPEENSLLLKAGDTTFELPSQDLVLWHPKQLLGERIWARFGRSFPIRFDFLDTMGGGNLSLQVHPTVDFARREFGLSYTQDESYYLLDAGEGASVYLGLKEGIDRDEMISDLRAAHFPVQHRHRGRGTLRPACAAVPPGRPGTPRGRRLRPAIEADRTHLGGGPGDESL